MLSGWSWTVSVMDWNASPSLNKTCLLKFSTPGPQNATVLGGGGLHRGDEVKWGHQGGLWPTRTVSLREEEIRTRTPEQRDGPVRTQGEDGCLRDEERGRRETQPCWHLDCGQPASRPWENISLLLKPPTCVCVCVSTHEYSIASDSFATPCSLPGSSVHGTLQARTLEWVVISSSRGSSWRRDETHIACVSSLAGCFFPTSTTCRILYGKPQQSNAPILVLSACVF